MQETQETQVQSLGQEDPLEEEMATHSGILACKISWTAEPGRLQTMGSQRVRHNWATELYHQVERYFMIREKQILMTSDFPSEVIQAKWQRGSIFIKHCKKKTLNPEFFTQ